MKEGWSFRVEQGTDQSLVNGSLAVSCLFLEAPPPRLYRAHKRPLDALELDRRVLLDIDFRFVIE